MRLINVEALLETPPKSLITLTQRPEPYAILSHRWLERKKQSLKNENDKEYWPDEHDDEEENEEQGEIEIKEIDFQTFTERAF